jgi:putative toxin-antitoxin system antitoxin component (TIGR02293 family)
MDILPVYLGKLSTMAKTVKPEPISNTYSVDQNTWNILGGKLSMVSEPVSAMDYVIASHKGISKLSVMKLAELMDIPLKEIAAMLNMSYKTFSRKNSGDLMDAISSSLSIEIAQTLAKGLAVFENESVLRKWLKNENRSLQGKKPIDLFNTPTGIKLVNRVLYRIEEGIYA